MKSISKILTAIILLLSTSCYAQLKNIKTETVKIYGNCEMCKKTIEKAGNLKNIATVDWNISTKVAQLSYDSEKTNKKSVLKRIALAGYDNDMFLAPDDTYAKLHGCCQYERATNTITNAVKAKTNPDKTAAQAHTMAIDPMESNPLVPVFENYFALKDALVKTDGTLASAKSAELLEAIKTVEMDKLSMEVHMVWMKLLSNLKVDAERIKATKDPVHQRENFMSLSTNMYAVIKVAKYAQPVYHQFCPMANGGKGANWLSKEEPIKNPYYGVQMMSCGKTVETIK